MPKRILVIDDEQIILKSIGRFLEGRGYEVEVAQSGREALEKVQNESYDLLVSDIRMPDMDGIETLRRIREKYQQQNNYKIPTVVITGYSSDDAEKQAAKLGVVDFLYKPFELDEFYSILRKNLEAKPVYRRAHSRVAVSFPIYLEPVDFQIPELSSELKGETLNLSEEGLCLTVKNILPENKQIKARIDFSPIKPAIQISAAIIWVGYKEETRSYHCGLKFSKLEETSDNILKEILVKYLFLDERLVALTKETEFYLQGVMNRFDRFDQTDSSENAQIAFVEKNKKDIFAELDKYFSNTWDIAKDFDKHKYLVHQTHYQRRLLPIFLRTEIDRHIYAKPLGYAGDFITMNYIFNYNGDTKYLGKSSFEKLINNYTCNIPICYSNIQRKDFFKQKILETLKRKDEAKIISIGSGSAQELIELLREEKIKKPLFFKCLDLEKNALGYVKKEIEKIDSPKRSFLAIDYLHRDVLAIIKDKELQAELKGQDLIYASGLFDYLRHIMASRLTKELYKLLNAGGELIICNADIDNCSHRAYYELLGGWNLIYKTKDEMLEWTKNIGDSAKINFENVSEKNKYLFLSASKKQ